MSESDDEEPPPPPPEEEYWIALQCKAFTGWMNAHLKVRKIRVRNLETDLVDGVALGALLEVLASSAADKSGAGEVASLHLRSTTSRVRQIDNLGRVFQLLRKLGVAMVNVGPEDICDGKMKLVLGLLWKLILKFQIQGGERFGGGDGDDSGFNAKDFLIQWCRERTATYKGVQVDNFGTSWNDGLAFCALVHQANPNLFDFDSLKASNNMENLALAFKLAEEHFGVVQLLEPSDFEGTEGADDKCVMTYVAMLKGGLANPNAQHEVELRAQRLEAERLRAANEQLMKLCEDLRHENKSLSGQLYETQTELDTIKAEARENMDTMGEFKSTLSALRAVIEEQRVEIDSAQEARQKANSDLVATKWMLAFQRHKTGKSQGSSTNQDGGAGGDGATVADSAPRNRRASQIAMSGMDNDLAALEAKLAKVSAERDRAEMMAKKISDKLLDRVEKQGYLKKKSGILSHTYKQKYVAVKAGFLLVWKDYEVVATGAKPSDVVSLIGAVAAKRFKDATDHISADAESEDIAANGAVVVATEQVEFNGPWLIRVTLASGKNVDLAVENAAEQDSWLIAINACCANRN